MRERLTAYWEKGGGEGSVIHLTVSIILALLMSMEAKIELHPFNSFFHFNYFGIILMSFYSYSFYSSLVFFFNLLYFVLLCFGLVFLSSRKTLQATVAMNQNK